MSFVGPEVVTGLAHLPVSSNAIFKEITPHSDIGMHYNYGTLSQVDAFCRQKDQIGTLTSQVPVAGRAHYLVMDPQDSFQFWEAQGMQLDESLGYPDGVGYRAGIAGPFKPFDPGSQKEASIISLPLVAMDSAIAFQFGKNMRPQSKRWSAICPW